MHLVLQPNDHTLVACNICLPDSNSSTPNHLVKMTSSMGFLFVLFYNLQAEKERGKLELPKRLGRCKHTGK